jgi:hypothetical protein
MSKISIEEVESKMLELKIDPIKVKQVVSELEKVVEELTEERKATTGPKQKWEHIIVLNDEEGILNGKEVTGWVVQQPDGAESNLILSKLIDAAKNQNEVTKKKANIINDFKSLFEHLKSKFTKEKNIRIKTKEPTRVIVTNGKFI